MHIRISIVPEEYAEEAFSPSGTIVYLSCSVPMLAANRKLSKQHEELAKKLQELKGQLAQLQEAASNKNMSKAERRLRASLAIKALKESPEGQEVLQTIRSTAVIPALSKMDN